MPSRVVPTLLVALLLVACGGGGGPVDPGSPGGGGGGGGQADPFGTLAPKTTFTPQDVRHLLRRTQFGFTPADEAAVIAVGVPAWVDQMLAFPALGTTPHEQAADALLGNATDPPGLAGGFPTQGQMAQWWEQLMLTNPNSFQEVLAFFWHDHFATSQGVLDQDSRWWFKAHVNLFRERGAGNLRDLLVRVARDWAMLRWLDGLASRKEDPNENFAREFWELFTRGVDNGYTQGDIEEAARAFTGYRPRFNASTGQSYVEFDPGRHDAGAKTVLGVTIPAQNATDDYQAVVDITLDTSPLTSLFIARKVLERFCYAAPPEGIVDGLAQVLRDADYEIAPMLRVLFLSEAFYASKAKEGMVKGPVEHGIGFVRTTGLAYRLGALDADLTALGNRPTAPPTVNGWPGGAAWLSGQGMVDRANLIRNAITARTFQASLGIDVASLLPSPTATSGAVVDALASRLDVTLTPEERALCVTYLDTRRQANGTVVPDPFDPANPTDVDERVRGLLYVLAQHPTFLMR